MKCVKRSLSKRIDKSYNDKFYSDNKKLMNILRDGEQYGKKQPHQEYAQAALKEFYKKLGFEVRFRPAYFPYTYLSTECEVYLEDKESWIELGGSGMFRPEVLKPLGVDVPVLAFGLGIERLAMIRYDISDIRMLYKSDIKWLRELPTTNGVRL